MTETFADWLRRTKGRPVDNLDSSEFAYIISQYGSEQYQAGMSQANQWCPVSEVPDKGRTITVCHDGDGWIETVDYDAYNNYALNMFEKATHWRYIDLPVVEVE